MRDPRERLRTVLESPAVLAVDKPAGMLTIPGRRGDDDPRACLVRELARRVPGKLWIVHRLDYETSGLLLFARSAEAHRVLCRLMERRGVTKRYEAWTEGEPPTGGAEPQVWEGRLVRGRQRVHESDRGKWCRTLASPRGRVSWRGVPLLRWELRPETGRPHQLRCQAAARGFPIAGDRRYGSAVPFLPGAIALRAVSLELEAASSEELEMLGIPRKIEIAGGPDATAS